MWHDLVSALNSSADRLLPRFAESFAQHPAIMTGFSLALAVLAVCMIRELAGSGDRPRAEERPMVLRR